MATDIVDLEQITAGLGGASPTLGRIDSIDGGSAKDIITIPLEPILLEPIPWEPIPLEPISLEPTPQEPILLQPTLLQPTLQEPIFIDGISSPNIDPNYDSTLFIFDIATDNSVSPVNQVDPINLAQLTFPNNDNFFIQPFDAEIIRPNDVPINPPNEDFTAQPIDPNQFLLVRPGGQVISPDGQPLNEQFLEPNFDATAVQESLFVSFPDYVGEYQGGSVFQLNGSSQDYVIDPYAFNYGPDGNHVEGWYFHEFIDESYFQYIVPNDSRVYVEDGLVSTDIYENGITGQVFRLYQAAFNRMPEQAALVYHINDIEVNGLSIEQIAKNFVQAPEFKTVYGENSTNEEFVNFLYQIILQRNASEFEVNPYVYQLENGLTDRAGLLLAFAQSAENLVAGTPSYFFSEVEGIPVTPLISTTHTPLDRQNQPSKPELVLKYENLIEDIELEYVRLEEMMNSNVLVPYDYTADWRQFWKTDQFILDPTNNTFLAGQHKQALAIDDLRENFIVYKSSAENFWTVIGEHSGVDLAIDYNRLEFDDGTLRLDVGANGYAGNIYRMYSAALDRTPDDYGFSNQIFSVESQGDSLYDVASSILSSPEFVSKYGSNLTDEQVVSIFYQNSFNRLPTENELDLYYRPSFANGSLNAELALVNFVKAPEVISSQYEIIQNGIWISTRSLSDEILYQEGPWKLSEYLNRVVGPTVQNTVNEKVEHFELVLAALSKFDRVTDQTIYSDSHQSFTFNIHDIHGLDFFGYHELTLDVYGSGLGSSLSDNDFFISKISAQITDGYNYKSQPDTHTINLNVDFLVENGWLDHLTLKSAAFDFAGEPVRMKLDLTLREAIDFSTVGPKIEEQINDYLSFASSINRNSDVTDFLHGLEQLDLSNDATYVENLALFMDFLSDVNADRVTIENQSVALDRHVTLDDSRQVMTIDYLPQDTNSTQEIQVKFHGENLGTSSYVIDSMEAEIFARMSSSEEYDSLLKLGFNFEGEMSAQAGVDFVKSLYIESAFGAAYHTNISQDVSEELSPAFFDALIEPYIPALENKSVLSAQPSTYTVAIDFSDNDAGDYIYVDASIDEFYLYDSEGNFKENDSFLSTDPNTYIFSAQSEFDFFGLNYAVGYNDDSEVVALVGNVASDGMRTIILGDSFSSDVEDWDAVSFYGLNSDININLSQLDPYNYDVIVTNGQGDLITYVGGAESVYGSNFNDLIVGDDARNILQGGSGDDRIEGGSGDDLLFGGKGFDEVIGGLGRDILVDLDGGFLTGNGQGGAEADTFVGGLNTTIMDFDFSPEGAGLSGNQSLTKDVVFIQITPEALLSAGVSTDELLSFAGQENSGNWETFKNSLDLRINSFENNNEVHIIHEPSGIKIGGISFIGSLSAGTEFNVIPMKTGVDSLLSQFESDVSDNRHVLEQLVSTDFSSSLYIPLALELIRQGTVRAEIVDRVFDPNDSEAGNFERVFILDRPVSVDAVEAAIFVLGNADDKIISAAGGGDRFEFIPQSYSDSANNLLGDQSFGSDTIVDIARRDPVLSQAEDIIYLKGVSSINEVIFSRTSKIGRASCRERV